MNIGIIGGGLIGLSLAYKLQKVFKNSNVTIFEKENELGSHQSTNNSGVLHCGLHYKNGSLKAKLAVNGISQMIDFCKENQIKHDICGKVVVSTNSYEDKILEKLASNGKLNGLNGLEFLSKSKLKSREPNVKSSKALLVPGEGIVDFRGVVDCLASKIKFNNGSINLNSKVIHADNLKNKVILKTNKIDLECDLVINCSGLQSDLVYENLLKVKRSFKIIPFRGEYFKFKPEYNDYVNHLVYPVPDPKFPFLGVHYTRLINGDLTVGPNAVLAFKREGYRFKDFSFKEFIDSITYPGLITFVLKHPKFCFDEIMSSLSKDIFLSSARKMIPDLKKNMIEKDYSGVRAQAIEKNGDLIMDFKVLKIKNQIHVLNAPSPGATSCFAIADHIINKYIL